MNRPSFAIRLVALALAVLLPVEAAHCAWMMSPVGRIATGMRADHACCRVPPVTSLPALPAPPADANPNCACLQLPQGVTTLATVLAASLETAVLAEQTSPLPPPAAPVLIMTSTADASPCRAPSLPAHLLRGPPLLG